jgi:SWI/SNF-related matrix-associated actin-dependent regulator 1 of chromatin subfamily A
MILDFSEASGLFTLDRAPEGPSNTELMRDYGMNIGKNVAYCNDPYTAAPFHGYATPSAAEKLKHIVAAYKASSAISSDAHIACPPDKELAPYQKASVEYLLARGGGLSADEPGLGKTMEAICFANEIKARRVLVICPASIRLQWVDRVREWSTMTYPFMVYPVLDSKRGVHPNAEWTVVSYNLARSPGIGRALAHGTYDLLVLDEAHALKTPDTARTRAIFGDFATGTYHTPKSKEKLFDALATKCGAVLALTGTPLPNRPKEAYVLGRNICWDAFDFMSQDAFERRFNPSIRQIGVRKDGTRYQYTDERVGRRAELQFRMRANFMARHLKRDVLTQLKLPQYDIVRVVETGPVRDALAAESLLGIDPDNFDPHDVKILGHIAQVRHQMGLAIAPQVADYVDMLMDGGETKLVVFAWHKDVLDLFQHRFEKYGVVRIDGSTDAKGREFAKTAFVHGEAQIIIGNTLSLGTGVDELQHVSARAILAEPDWVPGNNVQAVDRLDRFGQQRTVQADLFVAPKSVLEKVLASALRKAHNVHEALDGSIR